MSGGVDSAVTALLIRKQGYEPVGITAKMWPGAAAQDLEDARKVCAKLGMEHHSVDLCQVFHEQVVRRFVEEYDRGRTPNPCVYCNQHIKFGVLMRMLGQFGCEKFATGHYARVVEENGVWQLWRGADRSKDQSYVLYGLSPAQLAQLLLPLGEYGKDQVRQMAAEQGLIVARKSDSQDICFVPEGDYLMVLQREGLRRSHAGNFELADGTKLGKHKGTACYTIGQRKGLGIAYAHPLYVIGKDPGKNAVILGKDEELFQSELIATECNWLAPVPARCTAKIRYRAQDVECRIENVEFRTQSAECRMRNAERRMQNAERRTQNAEYGMQNGDGERGQQAPQAVRVRFAEPQRAITPGQAVVFYDGERILGGGIIRVAE